MKTFLYSRHPLFNNGITKSRNYTIGTLIVSRFRILLSQNVQVLTQYAGITAKAGVVGCN